MLDDMIDDSVASETRIEIAQHLEGCEHCEVTLSTTRKTIEIYRSHTLYESAQQLARAFAQSDQREVQEGLLDLPVQICSSGFLRRAHQAIH